VLDERLLVAGQRLLVEVSPAAFVEVERLCLGDRRAGVGLPGQRAQAGVVADRDRRRYCRWCVEDRDDEVESECGCDVAVGADRDRGLARLDPVHGDARHSSGFGTGDYRDTEGLSAVAQAAAQAFEVRLLIGAHVGASGWHVLILVIPPDEATMRNSLSRLRKKVARLPSPRESSAALPAPSCIRVSSG
jgi:hypothetical protein